MKKQQKLPKQSQSQGQFVFHELAERDSDMEDRSTVHSVCLMTCLGA